MRRWFFGFFLLSGFCSLLYQVIWLRLAMAHFGVTTPMVSIVLSVFMAGLALGSWAAGRIVRRAGVGVAGALRLYGAAELVIALSGTAVPWLLARARVLLSAVQGADAWSSALFHVASGACVTAILLPFCTCMGATFPLAMAAFRAGAPDEAERSFSYLYVANVVGAASGTLLSAFVLVERLGFNGALSLAAGLNAALAAAALWLSLSAKGQGAAPPEETPAHAPGGGGGQLRAALLATGLASMAMEVTWVRLFTAYLGTVVYTFATILAVYLTCTFGGSRAYRALDRRRPEEGLLGGGGRWAWAAAAGLLPLVACDPRLPLPFSFTAGALRVLLGVGAFSALLGYLTPMLVDRWSKGDPGRAGGAYAVNVIGCIVGPLLGGFLLIPAVGERWTLAVLALPLLVIGVLAARSAGGRMAVPALAAAAAGVMLLATRDFESLFARRQVLRDSTATVVATGEGRGRRLLVNGVSMTALTPIAKMMAHLPLALSPEPPRNGLTICFGMGTSFRSVLSWGIPSTVVELVPSVPRTMGYFHDDAAALMSSPLSQVVIDDGRRFLERSREQFDVIIVDPPPPLQAAGSSLLYSVEFCELARKRLRPGGILQNWIPGGDRAVVLSFVQAARSVFPHVRVMGSQENWGLHVLASDSPIPRRSPAEMASRLPAAARRDLVEWSPGASPEGQFALVLRNEWDPGELARLNGVRPLRDDRPINEYFLLRSLRGR